MWHDRTKTWPMESKFRILRRFRSNRSPRESRLDENGFPPSRAVVGRDRDRAGNGTAASDGDDADAADPGQLLRAIGGELVAWRPQLVRQFRWGTACSAVWKGRPQ